MRGEGLLQRWVRFNGVGALGIAVQLGVGDIRGTLQGEDLARVRGTGTLDP